MTAAHREQWLDYDVTFLEMRAANFRVPSPPRESGLALIRAESPPRRWFLHLYTSVGADHEWSDWLEAPPEQVDSFICDPDVALFTLLIQGWSGGFFVLDWREAEVCGLAYFGLTPEARGRGLSAWLLSEALRIGWSRSGVRRIKVETCSLDHPRALPLYQRAGFTPVGRERRSRLALPKA